MSDDNEKSSWLEPLPEEYAQDGDMTGRRMLVATLTVVVLAIFGGLVWYSYLEGDHSGPVPIVRADRSVVKEKPDTPGGLEVPDQDKRVFVRVDSEEPAYSEKLAASAEMPVDRPDAPETKQPKTQPDTTADPDVAEAVTDTAPVVDEEPAAAVSEKAAAIAPASKGATGKYLIQLGAFSKKGTAEGLWSSLQKQNGTLLSDLSPNIVMIDLGKKGVLYRLRGGRIAERATADNICSILKAKKQACIVVSN